MQHRSTYAVCRSPFNQAVCNQVAKHRSRPSPSRSQAAVHHHRRPRAVHRSTTPFAVRRLPFTKKEEKKRNSSFCNESPPQGCWKAEAIHATSEGEGRKRGRGRERERVRGCTVLRSAHAVLRSNPPDRRSRTTGQQSRPGVIAKELRFPPAVEVAKENIKRSKMRIS